MENILVVINIVLAIILVVVVLLQRSEGGALGLGVSQDNFTSSRSVGTFLTKLTAITAGLFMIMSVVLTITASVGSDRNVLESLPSINTEETSEEPSIPENN